MKKITLFIGGACIALSSVAQNNQSVKMTSQFKTSEVPYAPSQTPMLQNWQHGTPSPNHGGSRAVNLIAIGTAGNILTNLGSECNPLDASNALNTVVNLHRNNPANYNGGTIGVGNTSSQYRMDISQDGGGTFTNDIGPLNPVLGYTQANDVNCRYPQVSIVNPGGGTDPDSAYAAYLGSWHNGAATAQWLGVITGVGRLDGDTLTFTSDTLQIDTNETLIAASFCQGAPGTFWAVGWNYDATVLVTNVGLFVYKGTWNNATHNVDWVVNNEIWVPFDQTFDGTSYGTNVMIGFDATGNNGWIAFLGDVDDIDQNQTMEPVIYSTTDGGTTWSAPMQLNLLNFPCVVAVNDTLVPTTAFEADMIVDGNGHPHIGTTVGSGQTYSIFPGRTMSVVDIYNDGTDWKALIMGHVITLRDTIATSSTGGYYTQDNRPQWCVSPSGTKLMLLVSDDTTSGFLNTPDVRGFGFDIANMKATAPHEFTSATALGGVAFLHIVSPHGLYDVANSENIVPMTLTSPNASGAGEDPAQITYLQGVTFPDADFNIDVVPCTYFVGINETPSVSNISIYPNPADGIVSIELGAVVGTVEVIDITGRIVMTYVKSTGKISIDVTNLSNGIYSIRVSGASQISNQKLVVSH